MHVNHQSESVTTALIDVKKLEKYYLVPDKAACRKRFENNDVCVFAPKKVGVKSIILYKEWSKNYVHSEHRKRK